MKKRIISFVMSVVMAASIIISNPIPVEASVYSDVKTENMAEAFVTMESLGIMNASSLSKFGAAKKVNRAQFCNMLVKLTGNTDIAKTYANKKLFSDIKVTASYAGNVNFCYKMGYIKGKGNGLFKPKDYITYAEAVSSILRVLGYSSEDIGLNYPSDDINYAASLDLVASNVKANTKLNKSKVADLLYNALNADTKDGKNLYNTIKGVVRTKTAIVINNNEVLNGKEKIRALVIDDTSATVSNFTALNKISSDAEGVLGTLLLDKDSKVKGFIPSDYEHKDITVVEAKLSGIKASDNITYSIEDTAKVIRNNEVFTYGGTGYLEVDEAEGSTCRLIYDYDGNVKYVCLLSGSSSVKNSYYLEDGKDAEEQILKNLDIKGNDYNVTKNRKPSSLDLACELDSYYYDTNTNTICLSDYKLSGYIEYAYPSVKEAIRITIAGCEVEVLETAWESLKEFKIGEMATLILSDDNRVVAATKNARYIGDMMGLLSSDGKSVTLCGSGLRLTPHKLEASDLYRGGLVNITASKPSEYRCSGINPKYTTSKLDIKDKTYDGHNISSSASIYEWDGALEYGYTLYSLSGEMGKASNNFDDIYYTDSLPSTSVSYYHLNSADEIDIIILSNVTGNMYSYGVLDFDYSNTINISADGKSNRLVSVTNSSDPTGSNKYSNFGSATPEFGGICLTYGSNGSISASSVVELTSQAFVEPENFIRSNGKYYVEVANVRIPVSKKVEVYNEKTKKTYSGEEGIQFALNSELGIKCYYDKTHSSGAQIRLIIIN